MRVSRIPAARREMKKAPRDDHGTPPLLLGWKTPLQACGSKSARRSSVRTIRAKA